MILCCTGASWSGEGGCLKARGLAQAHVISLVLGFVWKDADTNHFSCKLDYGTREEESKSGVCSGFHKVPPTI